MKKTKVITLNFKGGWLFSIISSPKKTMEKELNKYNKEGYSVTEILPPIINPSFLIVQFLCILLLFWAYVPIPGYIFILEKDIEVNKPQNNNTVPIEQNQNQ